MNSLLSRWLRWNFQLTTINSKLWFLTAQCPTTCKIDIKLIIWIMQAVLTKTLTLNRPIWSVESVLAAISSTITTKSSKSPSPRTALNHQERIASWWWIVREAYVHRHSWHEQRKRQAQRICTRWRTPREATSRAVGQWPLETTTAITITEGWWLAATQPVPHSTRQQI